MSDFMKKLAAEGKEAALSGIETSDAANCLVPLVIRYTVKLIELKGKGRDALTSEEHNIVLIHAGLTLLVEEMTERAAPQKAPRRDKPCSN